MHCNRKRTAGSLRPNDTTQPEPKRQKSERLSQVVSEEDTTGHKIFRLLQLPDELLLNILEQARGLSTPWATYANLAIVCKRLNGLCTPFIYEAVSTDGINFQKFLQTIIANPTLASRVKSMTYWHDYTNSICTCFVCSGGRTATCKPKALSSQQRRELRTSLKNLGLSGSDRSCWEQWYARGADEDLLALTMLHTPNLESLILQREPVRHTVRIRTTSWLDIMSYHEVIEHAARKARVGNILMFQNLRVLRLSARNAHFRDMVGLFKLPNLRRLTILHLQTGIGERADLLPDGSHFGTSSVDILSLLDTGTPGAYVVQLISLCRELKACTVTYEHGYDQIDASEFDLDDVGRVDYVALSQALDPHRSTLKHLHYSDVYKDHDHASGEESRGYLDSLREFEKLLSLAIPSDAICGSCSRDDWVQGKPPKRHGRAPPVQLAEMLPASLSYFWLTVFSAEEDNDLCHDSLLELAKQIAESEGLLPRLKRIAVDLHTDVSPEEISFVNPRRALADVNVLLAVYQDGEFLRETLYDSDNDSIGYDEDDLELESEYDDMDWPDYVVSLTTTMVGGLLGAIQGHLEQNGHV